MKSVFYIIICGLLLAVAALAVSGTLLPGDREHHTAAGFRNPPPYTKPGWLAFLKWRLTRSSGHLPSVDSYQFPVAPNDPSFLRSNRSRTTYTWIGHATGLLQLGGLNILTDPHFTERASPVGWAGPKRVVPPGLALDDLPDIDAVVISHDHYDSLDRPTILRLAARRNGQATVFFVPLGLKAWFARLGIDRVVELDWWQSAPLGSLEITAVPAQHWSKRGLLGQNRSLWAGWVVSAPGFRFYFAGDSGYGPLFKEIGRRAGPFDLATVPIGAYAPRWFMRSNHVNPEEALQIHRDVGAARSVAVHWGTFELTDEPLDEPPQRLAAARQAAGLPPEAFRVVPHGTTLIFP